MSADIDTAWKAPHTGRTQETNAFIDGTASGKDKIDFAAQY